MPYPPMKILLATEGSQDVLAVRAALDLSSSTASELHVVHAWQAFPKYSHPSRALTSDSALYERKAQEVLFEEDLLRFPLVKGRVRGQCPAGMGVLRERLPSVHDVQFRGGTRREIERRAHG